MASGDVIRPFRWDVAQRSQLGLLPDVELNESYRESEGDLLRCATRVIAFGGDSDLGFIGRYRALNRQSTRLTFDLVARKVLTTSDTGLSVANKARLRRAMRCLR